MTNTLDEAITFVDSRPAPLAVYVFSNSPATVARVERGTQSGAVVANHLAVQVLVSEAGFGGVGESGTGRHRGRAGLELDYPDRAEASLDSLRII
ncbi:MAG: hypothetical protein AMXMBFR46_03490 [Acidimicrobiia bacterium]